MRFVVVLLLTARAYGECQSGFGFQTDLDARHLQARTRLGALIEVGHRSRICLSITHVNSTLLSGIEQRDSVENSATLQQFLHSLGIGGAEYGIELSHDVLVISPNGSKPSQQDQVISQYSLDSSTLQEASVGLFTRLVTRLTPGVSGIAVTIHQNNRNNIVGPLDLQDSTVGTILSALLRESTGGAWVGWYGPPASPTSSPTWAIVDYQTSPPALVEAVGALAAKLTKPTVSGERSW